MTKEKPLEPPDSLFELTNPYRPFELVPEDQEYPPFMLGFRWKKDRIHSCNYNYFLDATYTPTQIIFRFYDTTTIVKGRNLKPIMEALTQYRLDYVQEWEPGMGTVPESGTCIDSIEEELPAKLALLEAKLLAEAEKESRES